MFLTKKVHFVRQITLGLNDSCLRMFLSLMHFKYPSRSWMKHNLSQLISFPKISRHFTQRSFIQNKQQIFLKLTQVYIIYPLLRFTKPTRVKLNLLSNHHSSWFIFTEAAIYICNQLCGFLSYDPFWKYLEMKGL